MSAENSAIYETLLAGCPPAPLPKPWSYVKPDPDVRVFDVEPEVAIAALREQFDDDDLLKSQVVMEQRGKTRLNPVLCGPHRRVIAVRNESNQLTSIVSAKGDLRRQVPLFALERDPALRRGLAATNQTIYVATMEDCVVLRALGIPAAPLTHLDRLVLSGLKHLFGLVGGDALSPVAERRFVRSPTVLPPPDDCRRLAFIGCHLASLGAELPDEILAAASYLARAERYLGIDLENVWVWWPSEEELRDLAYCVQLQDAALVRECLDGSDSNHLFDIGQFEDPTRPPEREKPFVTAYRDVVAAMKNPRLQSDQTNAAAQREFDRQVDERLFAPLLDSALEKADPHQRALGSALAYVARMFHRAMPAVSIAFDKQLEPGALARSGLLADKLHRDLDRQISQMIRLTQAQTRLSSVQGKGSNARRRGRRGGRS